MRIGREQNSVCFMLGLVLKLRASARATPKTNRPQYTLHAWPSTRNNNMHESVARTRLVLAQIELFMRPTMCAHTTHTRTRLMRLCAHQSGGRARLAEIRKAPRQTESARPAQSTQSRARGAPGLYTHTEREREGQRVSCTLNMPGMNK